MKTTIVVVYLYFVWWLSSFKSWFVSWLHKELNGGVHWLYFFGTWEPLIFILKLVTQSCYAILGHKNWVLCISWSPDGQHLVSGSKAGEILSWDPQTGKQLGSPFLVSLYNPSPHIFAKFRKFFFFLLNSCFLWLELNTLTGRYAFCIPSSCTEIQTLKRCWTILQSCAPVHPSVAFPNT